jgi:hypothetical protein
MILSLTAQTHYMCVNECPGGKMNNERGIQRDGECLCLCLLDFTDLFRTLFL